MSCCMRSRMNKKDNNFETWLRVRRSSRVKYMNSLLSDVRLSARSYPWRHIFEGQPSSLGIRSKHQNMYANSKHIMKQRAVNKQTWTRSTLHARDSASGPAACLAPGRMHGQRTVGSPQARSGELQGDLCFFVSSLAGHLRYLIPHCTFIN